jgi:hypothetical protein
MRNDNVVVSSIGRTSNEFSLVILLDAIVPKQRKSSQVKSSQDTCLVATAARIKNEDKERIHIGNAKLAGRVTEEGKVVISMFREFSKRGSFT